MGERLMVVVAALLLLRRYLTRYWTRLPVAVG